MNNVSGLFADLAAALEDAHVVAIEAASPDLSADIHELMLAAVKQGLLSVQQVMLDIAAALP